MSKDCIPYWQIEMGKIASYWDKIWTKRIDGNYVMHNSQKRKVLLNILKNRNYKGKEIMEVGCGTAIHAMLLSAVDPYWQDHWTGVDLSERAVNFARERGFNAHCADFLDFSPPANSPQKFDVFLFLDSMEHLENLDEIANRVRIFSNPKYIVFGNVPLYQSEHEKDGGFERHMDIHVVCDFLKKCGMEGLCHRIYGINGYPYMWFEAEANQ